MIEIVEDEFDGTVRAECRDCDWVGRRRDDDSVGYRDAEYDATGHESLTGH